MKVVGQIVELDPNKKYVMLIQRDVLSPETLASHYGANVRVVHDDGDVFVLPQRG